MGRVQTFGSLPPLVCSRPEPAAGERPLFRTSNVTENCLTSIWLAVFRFIWGTGT